MTDPVPQAPITILLVEDNDGDARLAMEALNDSALHYTLHHVSDGVEALDFLYRRGSHRDAPPPDLILLDLNLPRKDGRTVLAETLRQIPVVVLSISGAEADINTCYSLHANCYIIKPLDYTQFARVMQAIGDFWLTTVKLPGHCT